MSIITYNHLNGKIIFGRGSIHILEQLIQDMKPYKKALIIDENVSRFHNQLINELSSTINPDLHIELPGGEQTKTIDTVRELWINLYEKEFTRTSVLIAIGGGVIGDLSGFTASTYMRGIKFIYIPTTLLAQADSCIGGKNGVDFKVKNLIGTFYIPTYTIIDPIFITTLPKREFRNGLAEIIKHGIIGSEKILKMLEKNMQEINAQNQLIEKLIRLSIEVKLNIVELDYKESGVRRILNLGHTFGHAIEKISDYKISHGEAVSMGIATAARISKYTLGFTGEKRIINILRNHNLPTEIPYTLDEMEEALLHDKKRWSDKLTLILIREIEEVIPMDIELEELKRVWEAI